jgi:hypothetical protein
MNNVEDVWWCRTPKNSVVYGSGERRIRGQRRIALHCLCSRIRDFPFSGLFSTPNNPSVEVKVYIPYGNYDSSSFMSQFIASVLASNSTLGTGLSITLNVVTNRYLLFDFVLFRFNHLSSDGFTILFPRFLRVRFIKSITVLHL